MSEGIFFQSENAVGQKKETLAQQGKRWASVRLQSFKSKALRKTLKDPYRAK